MSGVHRRDLDRHAAEELARAIVLDEDAPFTFPGLRYCAVTVSPSFDDGWYAAHGIDLPAAVARSVARRRREFFFGRLCARTAVRRLQPEFDGTLPVLADRRPGFPAGVSGSITHCDGFAAAVCVPAAAGTIGIDAEPVLCDARADEVRPVIAAVAETELPALAALDPALRLTAIFCAKEAAFKALSSRVRRIFDFDAVAVIGASGDTLLCEVRHELGSVRAGTRLSAQFAVAGERVIALVVFDG